MNWSWKSFGLQLGGNLLLGLGLGYAISLMIEAKRGSGGPDATVVSMVIGGLIASLLLSLVSGWKGWGYRPFAAAGMIVAILVSGKLAGALLVLIVGTFGYVSARKAHALACYYFPKESASSEASIQDP